METTGLQRVKSASSSTSRAGRSPRSSARWCPALGPARRRQDFSLHRAHQPTEVRAVSWRRATRPIRGHRRTYTARAAGEDRYGRSGRDAEPVFSRRGRQMSTDFRGDPASACAPRCSTGAELRLNDHYLGLRLMTLRRDVHHDGPTAPASLPLGRMEIIELSGYTEFEKSTSRRQVPASGSELQVRRGEGRHHRRDPHGGQPLSRRPGVRTRSASSGACSRKIAAGARPGREGGGTVQAMIVLALPGVPKYRVGRRRRRRGGSPRASPSPVFGATLLAAEVAVV